MEIVIFIFAGIGIVYISYKIINGIYSCIKKCITDYDYDSDTELDYYTESISESDSELRM